MASSSSNYHPRSSVATGYPAGAANGFDPTPSTVATPAASTTYPYYPNPNVYYSSNPNPNNSYYYQNPNPNPDPDRNPFLRRLLIIIISVFFAMGAITVIVSLVLRPRLPTFSLSSLNVANFNLSPSSLSSSFDLSLSVHNPNSKMTVDYRRILADVSVVGNPVASTCLPPFTTQPKGNSTAISAKMTAANVFVDSYVVDVIRSRSGVVGLDVRAVALARFWDGALRTRMYQLRVFCKNVVVKFRNGTAGDGAMTGGPRQCSVGSTRWVGI